MNFESRQREIGLNRIFEKAPRHRWVMTLCLTGLICWIDGTASGQEPAPGKKAAPSTPVKHLYVATLQLRRLNKLELTSQQKASFERLSRQLSEEISKKRKAVGIDKDLIKRRDEVFSKLKQTDLDRESDQFWVELQTQANLTAKQRDVFRETQQRYKKFRNDVLKILTPEQRTKFKQIKPQSKKKDSKNQDSKRE